jgi:hypothetical protein
MRVVPLDSLDEALELVLTKTVGVNRQLSAVS